MSFQLPADCLNEIFENLEKDIFTLHSCLLVNHLWCEVSVRILWRNVVSKTSFHPFRMNKTNKMDMLDKPQLYTLISCLPKESKDLLYNNKIISTLNSKTPLFNYVSFCKVLSINNIHYMVNNFLSNRQLIDPDNFKNFYLLTEEILKMFMNQISSLKKLSIRTYDAVEYIDDFYDEVQDIKGINFTHFLGTKNCLTELSELTCSSNGHSKFFYQLSQICHNIQSLNIYFEDSFSDGLNDLISSQNNLKYLSLVNDDDYEDSYMDIDDIETSLTKHSDTILRLYLLEPSSLSYIIKFINLQELVIAFFTCPEEFEILQHITFPHLKILKFVKECPKVELVIKFLENNGKNLKEFCSHRCDNSLSLAIAKCCSNLKFLYVQFMKRETLREIFDNCQQLECIEVWSDEKHLKGKEVLEIVAKHSPKNFHKLRLYESNISELHTKDLESFFIEWNNRLPQKSLSFIIHNVQKNHLIHDDNFEKNNRIKKIIEKYKDLNVIKKFKFIKSYELDFSIHLPDTLLYSNYYEEGIFCI